VQPETRYAHNGEVSIAYQVSGEGAFDLVFVSGFVSHVEVMLEEPTAARFFDRLAGFSRLIRYDKREQGLSDRTGQPPTLEESMEDLRAVLDAAGSKEAALLGISEGGPMCQLFAATHPSRVRALVLYGTYSRIVEAPDYPIGVPPGALDRWRDGMAKEWGGPASIELFAPSMMDDARFRSWWARLLRSGSSPGGMVRLMDLYREVDTREVLSSITAPVLVLHRSDDRLAPVGWGRYLGEHIPGARYVELRGRDHLVMVRDQEELLDEVEEFLTGSRREREPERVLATVVFGDIVQSTERAADFGDARWRDLLAAHDARVREQLERSRGRLVKTMGDGFLATFDGPARAIRFGSAIRDGVRELGLELRVGVHTGEIEKTNGDIGGLAVHIGARVGSAAGAGEVLASGTVKDLVVGSGIRFSDRGAHQLKGVPGEWRLYAVEG
jgi:pimeloyl-ACP methyl ester carboxylesterase